MIREIDFCYCLSDTPVFDDFRITQYTLQSFGGEASLFLTRNNEFLNA